MEVKAVKSERRKKKKSLAVIICQRDISYLRMLNFWIRIQVRFGQKPTHNEICYEIFTMPAENKNRNIFCCCYAAFTDSIKYMYLFLYDRHKSNWFHIDTLKPKKKKKNKSIGKCYFALTSIVWRFDAPAISSSWIQSKWIWWNLSFNCRLYLSQRATQKKHK